MEKQPRWLFIFNSVSTTNLRIYVSMVVYVMTSVAYLGFAKPISWEWVTLLGGMAGLDMAHFATKRFSDSSRTNGTGQQYGVEEDDEESTQTTDIQERAADAANQPG